MVARCPSGYPPGDAPARARACPAGAPLLLSKAVGKPPGPAGPGPGAHGGGGLYGQGVNRPRIAACFLGAHATGAAAPRAARIAVTPQALRAAALYRLRPPGRHRCHAPEIPRRSLRVCVGRGDPARLPGPLSLPCSVGRGLAPAACPPGISWGTPQYYLTIPHLSEVYFFDRPEQDPQL